MATGVAWVLNFEAEVELELGKSATAPASMRARRRELAAKVEALTEGGLVLFEGGREGEARGLEGRAWCPTPQALRWLARAGATLPPHPTYEVLRRVNARAFCAALGQTLEGARHCTAMHEVEATVRGACEGGRWLLKRDFGVTGRGRLRVDRGELSPEARAWVTASFRRGDGLEVEPFCELLADFALHGELTATGALRLGEPTALRLDPGGAWAGSELAGDAITADERVHLVQSATQTAAALHQAGYFGPFNVDAFRYRAGGAVRFNPRCEINARYSMGWAVGMGLARRPPPTGAALTRA